MTSIKLSAFSQKGKWFKGNIHAHTTVSDGTVDPAQQAADYRAKGYNFLSLTDHNIMHTHARYNCDDFVMLPGWERDIPLNGKVKCIHLVGLFPSDMPPDAQVSRQQGDPDVMSMQDLVNEMNSEKQFVVLAHPIWSHMEPEEVRALSGFDSIEVFNTGTERLCHAGRADVYWDMLLREGKHVYAIACDDTHGKTTKSDRFGGWIMVNAESLTQEALLSAIHNGNFYASCGPELYDVSIEDDILHVRCSACSEIHVISYPPRGKAHYAEDKMLTELTYPLKGGETYIRVECVDADGNPAWSNAIFLNP